jgi:hypothetical protein
MYAGRARPLQLVRRMGQPGHLVRVLRVGATAGSAALGRLSE